MTKQALAKLMGVDNARITNIEAGRVDARVSTVWKLAAALNVTPAALLT